MNCLGLETKHGLELGLDSKFHTQAYKTMTLYHFWYKYIEELLKTSPPVLIIHSIRVCLYQN